VSKDLLVFPGSKVISVQQEVTESTVPLVQSGSEAKRVRKAKKAQRARMVLERRGRKVLLDQLVRVERLVFKGHKAMQVRKAKLDCKVSKEK